MAEHPANAPPAGAAPAQRAPQQPLSPLRLGQLALVGVTAGLSSVLSIALLQAAGQAFPAELTLRAWPQWALQALVVGSLYRACSQVLGWMLGPPPSA